jgi:hypothetical protein
MGLRLLKFYAQVLCRFRKVAVILMAGAGQPAVFFIAFSNGALTGGKLKEKN